MIKIFLVFMMLIFLVAPAYSQDSSQARNYQTADGTVTSFDWVGSLISINDARFSVSSDVKVYKGDDSIGVDDINVGDQVTVTYYDDPPGVHKIVTIVVQYSGDWAV